MKRAIGTPAGKLVLLHLPGNALLLWLGYEWLGLGESTRLHLVWSALAALAILALACWLHGAAFVCFRSAGNASLKEVFRTALRHIPPLLLAAILVLVVYFLLAWCANASAQPAFKLASWLTLHLRKPVKPATVARIFLGVFWIVRWVILPVGLLPMASGIAVRGWRGFADFTWRAPWRYWLMAPALLLIGLALPFVVMRWIPHFDAFAMQMTSFAVRMLIAYFLFVAAVLMLASATSRGRPVLSQPKTAATP